MARILLQTTIQKQSDNWTIDRFSRLADLLRADGHDVAARDRRAGLNRTDDQLLEDLALRAYDEVWIIACDKPGEGLAQEEVDAIAAFHAAGGALLVTRDHEDLGTCVIGFGPVGRAHNFHSYNTDAVRRHRDDHGTPSIQWPNYHSGANGDVQWPRVLMPGHPAVRVDESRVIGTLPAHPHEGAISVPLDASEAYVVLMGVSRHTYDVFPISIAFDTRDGRGRAWAQSSFHHFADYNFDPRAGAPTLVTERPSNAVVQNPALLDDTYAFWRNVAKWLASDEGPSVEREQSLVATAVNHIESAAAC